MTEAAFWCGVCAPRMFPDRTLVRSLWCRRTLAEAAVDAKTTGFCAMTWTFADGSLLIASDAGVQVSFSLRADPR